MWHLQSYTIGWLHQVRYLHVSQQFHLPYSIKPFIDEVFRNISPLELFDLLLGKPYLWKHYVVYESRPCTIIINLENSLYRIWELSPPTAIALISTKKCSKTISQDGNFIFFCILSQSKGKIVATSMALGKGYSKKKKEVYKVMEEYMDIFYSSIGVPLHY